MSLKKIKILFITYTHSNGGGAEAVLTTLVNNLDSEKYECTILEYEHKTIKVEPIKENIILLKRSIIETTGFYKIFNSSNNYWLHKSPKVLVDIFNINDYDVYITWNYQLPSFILPGIQSKNKIAWFHGSIEDLEEQNKFTKKNKDRQRISWKNVKKIVTISNRSQQSLFNVFPELKNLSTVIFNPTNIKKIKDLSGVIAKKTEIKEHKSIISIGRLDSNKNISLGLQALAQLKDEGLIYNYYLIGTGELEKDLRDLVKKLQIGSQVFFCGYQQNPYSYLKNADLLCLTSLSEGWGMVVAEAMVLGKPFVTTPVAGASEELANNGKCGLVADFSPTDYALKIKAILENDSLYKTMSKNCQEHIKKYSIEETIKSFDALIAETYEKEKKSKSNKSSLLKYILFNSLNIPNIVLNIEAVILHIDSYKAKHEKKTVLKIFYRIARLLISVISIPIIFPIKIILNSIYILIPKK